MTMIENMDIEDSIVCPYCFHEHKGPLFNFRAPTPWECERCYYFFTVDAVVSVKFSTHKSDCLNREGPHVFGDWVASWGERKKVRQCRDCGVKEYESD